MRRMRPFAFALLAAVALVSCNRDPNVAKKRYIESGNKYFEKGRYKEASIQYRNAIKIDPKYGEAHYRLALTDLKLPVPDYAGAVRALRRAAELIDESQPNRWDAVTKMAELYIVLAPNDEVAMKEAEDYCKELLKRDPNSFDGHRLTGDISFVRARNVVRSDKEEFQKNLQDAMAEYHRADSIKPGDSGVSLQLARGLVLSGDPSGAETLYRGVLDRDKKNVQAYRELFQLLIAERKPTDAENFLKTAYQNNPKQYDFLFLLAQLYLQQNRRDDMLSVLQQIKSKAGENPRAYFEVGNFYFRVGDADSAIKEYREGMAKDPKNKAGYQKGIIEVLLREGKRAEAAQVNDQILKDNPNDADSRGLAATFMLEKGDVAHALPELQQVVSRTPQNPVAHFNLGRAYYVNDDIEQARQEFNKALEIRADYMAARLALADLQVKRGEYDEALKAVQDILKTDPENRAARLLQSQAMMGQKKFDDSRQVLAGILKANPAATDAIYMSGLISAQEKKYKEAAELFRKAYQLNPNVLFPLQAEVQAYVEDKQPEMAIQRLQSEIQKNPKHPGLHLLLGDLSVQMGRYSSAIGEFRVVLESAPKAPKVQAELNMKIGEAQRLSGDFKSAIDSFQAARKIAPDDARVFSSLAVVLEQAGQWREARQSYEASLKLEPNNGLVLNNLAYGMTEHNEDLNQALELARRARQLKPNSPDVADTLGWIYLKKSLSDNALDIFRDLVTKQPNHPTFRYHLAMALLQKGDKVHAKDELRKALDLNPGQQERQQIQDLLKRQ